MPQVSYNKVPIPRKVFKLGLLAIVLYAFSSPLMGQLDNSIFFRPLVVDSTQKFNTLECRVSHLSFLKNNEYFNNIQQGYTLFGHLNYFSLVGQVHPNFRLEGGIVLRKDFGNPSFSLFQPMLSAIYQKNKHKLIFGNLEAQLQHRYIEPLMDFENLILQPLESGLQYKYQGTQSTLNLWIDWLNAIYPGDTVQEQIRAGILLNTKVYENKNWQLKIPLQGMFFHQGGQLSPQPLPIENQFNGALGLELKYRSSEQAKLDWQLEGYYCYSLDFSPQKSWRFTEGQGVFINFGLKNPYLPIVISYWKGREFISLQGGKLYPSVGESPRYPGYFEEERQLLFLRLIKDLSISETLKLSLRFEPFYDFNRKDVEHSLGLYLFYDGIFGLISKP
jgi:hypothetical protein